MEAKLKDEAALARVREAVDDASVGHGRFSCWTGNKMIEIPLDVMKRLVAGEANEVDKEVVRAAASAVKRPDHEKFSTWAGPRAAYSRSISVDDLLAVLRVMRRASADERSVIPFTGG